jgi:hypothetical protein
MPKRRKTSDNYRKPPVEHQFKPGTSGNPLGRPPKNAVQTGLGPLGGIVDRLSAMALEEAMRPITVREGGKVSEIPAVQALFRTMFRAAAEGDARAGRQVLELIARAERERVTAATERRELWLDYKNVLSPVFEEWERQSVEPLHIYPHPDDVIIDEATGEVTFDGPRSRVEAGKYQEMREAALELKADFAEVEAALEKDPSNRELRQELRDLTELMEFDKKDRSRALRHKMLRWLRQKAKPRPSEPKPSEPKTSDPKDDTPDEA